jgi:hypothetical protein
MNRQRVHKILLGIETIESFIGQRQTYVHKDLQRPVRRLRVRVHSKSVKRPRAPQIKTVEISNQLRSLRRYKQLIRRLSLKKASRGERRRILPKVGLFLAILPPLISGIVSLLTPAVGYMLRRHAED